MTGFGRDAFADAERQAAAGWSTTRQSPLLAGLGAEPGTAPVSEAGRDLDDVPAEQLALLTVADLPDNRR